MTNKNIAWLLGAAGLIPFIGLPLLATTHMLDWYTALDGFRAYSAVILSFLGGPHWFDAISAKKTGFQIVIAMLPSIVAWAALFIFPPVFSLGVLSLGFLLLMIYEKHVLTLPKDTIIWYTKLRIMLTTGVVLTHAWMITVLS